MKPNQCLECGADLFNRRKDAVYCKACSRDRQDFKKKQKPMFVKRSEVLSDLAEILNNLEDDLMIDKVGESGYISEEEAVKAVRRFTLKVVKKKYKKYGGRIC